jgi:hypothetical protein
VTTDADFRRFKESLKGTGGRLERADRIYFKRCSHAEVLGRIEELIETIEFEYRAAKESDRKFFMQITRDTFTVFR